MATEIHNSDFNVVLRKVFQNVVTKGVINSVLGNLAK